MGFTRCLHGRRDITVSSGFRSLQLVGFNTPLEPPVISRGVTSRFACKGDGPIYYLNQARERQAGHGWAIDAAVMAVPVAMHVRINARQPLRYRRPLDPGIGFYRTSGRPSSANDRADLDNKQNSEPSFSSPHSAWARKYRPFVGVSEIASLINVNPYVSVADAVERLWEKNNKRSFKEALQRNKIKSYTPEERLDALGLLELTTSIVEADNQEKYKQRLGKALQQVPTTEDRKVLRDFVNTCRGIRTEKRIFNSMKEHRPTAQLESDPRLYQRLISIPETAIQYYISGYIDGVEADKGRIIEIKTRQNRLFDRVPLYEQVQCQGYMFLTGLRQCEHTESFQGKVQSTTLLYQAEFWERVLQQLNTVIVTFVELLSTIGAQDLFLQTRDLHKSVQNARIQREEGGRSHRDTRESR
jgi:hypothetical protein